MHQRLLRTVSRLKRFALILLISGFVISGLALMAQTTLTPVGGMDCGCGGATACVTKQGMGMAGLSLFAGGTVLIAGTSMLVWSLMLRRSFPRTKSA